MAGRIPLRLIEVGVPFVYFKMELCDVEEAIDKIVRTYFRSL